VAKGGIEPPTRGFSILLCGHLSVLMRVDRINVNQQVT